VGTTGCINGAADAAPASPVDATRTPPVTMPTATSRTCAKRMIMPLPALFVATCGTTIQYGVATSGVERPPRSYPPLDTMPSARRYSLLPSSLRSPVASRLITTSRSRLIQPITGTFRSRRPVPLAPAEQPAASARLDAVTRPGRPPNSPPGAKPQVRQVRPAPLAQSAERLHGKEKVYGSIP
jgi:hypothetical protein